MISIEDLSQISQAETRGQGRRRAPDQRLRRGELPLPPERQGQGGAREGGRGEGKEGLLQGPRRRLHGPLRGRPPRRRREGEGPLPGRDPRGRPRHRRRPRRRAGGADPGRPRGAVLRPAAEDRPGELRPDRPGADRGVHRRRRLPRPRRHADRDDADRRRPAGDAVGPARPRRGGLPDRAQVGDRRQGARGRGSSSSATATRATRAPSWTARSSRATRTGSSRGWRSPATRSARQQGFVYVRAEYPLAIKRLKLAIKQAEKMGLLGANIGGTTFSFNVDIRLGAGAFVCGEETALIASIEGGRGTPRPRPPYPAESGLWGYPTLINNVETLANIPPILRNGGEWFAKIGTAKSQGHEGLRPRGRDHQHRPHRGPDGDDAPRDHLRHRRRRPRRQGVQGRADGRPLGRLHPGVGASTCRSTTSRSRKLGSIMGSGGMIVMDETSSMVDVAKFFMEFCMDESCGKCVPCRVGTAQMHELLRQISTGEATARELALLEDLCDVVKATSLCGLGQTAPEPGPLTLRYFREEYEAKIAAGEAAAAGHGLAGGRCRVSSRPRRQARGPRAVEQGQDPHDRRPARLRPRGRDDPRRRPRERDPDPDALQPRRPEPVGACRLCMVEVKGSSKLFAACVTMVGEGMEVVTDSERLQRYRQDDRRAPLRRAEPRLRRLRLERPLRAPEPGAGPRRDAPAVPYRTRSSRSTPRTSAS